MKIIRVTSIKITYQKIQIFPYILTQKNFQRANTLLNYLLYPIRISDYVLKSFHKDFEGTKFSLNKGDIVGYFGSYSFNIDKQFGSLNEPESFFEWEDIDDEDYKGRAGVYVAGDKIKIQIYEQDKVDIFPTHAGYKY